MDLGLKEVFMNLNPKAIEVKAKISKWNYIRIKPSAQPKKLTTKQKGNQQNEK